MTAPIPSAVAPSIETVDNQQPQRALPQLAPSLSSIEGDDTECFGMGSISGYDGGCSLSSVPLEFVVNESNYDPLGVDADKLKKHSNRFNSQNAMSSPMSHYVVRRRRIVHRSRLRGMVKTQKRRDRALRTTEIKQQRLLQRQRAMYRPTDRGDGPRTRVDLRNDTKLNIASHYLENKQLDRNYNAKECKREFMADNVECGRFENIWRWSKNEEGIKENIARFGPQKKRNRERKSWFHGMEEMLYDEIQANKRRDVVGGGNSNNNIKGNRNRNQEEITNQWIQNKAVEIQKEMYPDREFKASYGWLRNFKQRYPDLL